MSNRLKNRVAFIAGAGSSSPGWGNGKATAVLFAREGAKVFAVDINLQAAMESKEIIDKDGGNCSIFQANLTKEIEIKNAVEQCIREYERIDILHNNLGIATFGGPVETTPEDWQKVFDTNLTSYFLTCKHILPYMEKQGRGSIINISSVAAIRSPSNVSYITYSTTKAAILQLTQSVALQYAKKGIRVNCVLPGLMDTPMIEPLKIYYENDLEKMRTARNLLCPMGKQGDAWDVAYAVLFLASDESKYITGTQLIVDGGLSCKV